jgi:hypothetical protein
MYSLALIIFVVSEKKAFEYFPIGSNVNLCPAVVAILVGSRDHRTHFGKGSSKDHSTKVWLQLAQWFLRRRLKCEMLTDGRRTRYHEHERYKHEEQSKYTEIRPHQIYFLFFGFCAKNIEVSKWSLFKQCISEGLLQIFYNEIRLITKRILNPNNVFITQNWHDITKKIAEQTNRLPVISLFVINELYCILIPKHSIK